MVSVSAPCKINVSLQVLGKRDDGFHEIETIMAPLELCDTLEFSPAKELSMSCDTPGVPVDESNLVMKAARLMERELGRPMPWHIHLIKHVPHGAGLGGGSSDAACVLRTLNELENAGLSNECLTELAGEIGSDIGFFIYNQVCQCSGRGEKITPLNGWAGWSPHLLLLKPSFGVSTPDAYKRWQNSKELPHIPYAPQSVDGHILLNDLERPVFEKHLFLAEIKCWLLNQEGVQVAMMSGSGSTMFAIVNNAQTAEKIIAKALDELDPTFWSWHGKIKA